MKENGGQIKRQVEEYENLKLGDQILTDQTEKVIYI